MKLVWVVLLMGGIAWGQDHPCLTKAPCKEIRPEWGTEPLANRAELMAAPKSELVERIFNLRKALKNAVDRKSPLTGSSWFVDSTRVCTVPPDDPKKLCDETQPSQKAKAWEKNAHYQCLYNYDKLTDGQQHACAVLNMIEGSERRTP